MPLVTSQLPLYPPGMITLTEAAVRQLQSLIAEKGDGSKGLRLLVEKGGCAGLQYGMTLDSPAEGDEVFPHGDVSIIIDPESLHHLRGSEIDYCDDLTGTGFRLKNPNAVRSCGCGTSFETAEHAEHGENAAN
jgi:iron-sulfur cluster assembly protein